MKRFMALALALLMAFSLFACGKKAGEVVPDTTDPTVEEREPDSSAGDEETPADTAGEGGAEQGASGGATSSANTSSGSSGSSSKPSGGTSKPSGSSGGSSSSGSSSSGGTSRPSGGSSSGGSSSGGSSSKPSGGGSTSGGGSSSGSGSSGGSSSSGSGSGSGSGSSSGSGTQKLDKWVYDEYHTEYMKRLYGKCNEYYDKEFYCSEEAGEKFNALGKKYVNGEVSAEYVKSEILSTKICPSMWYPYYYDRVTISDAYIEKCSSDNDFRDRVYSQVETCNGRSYGYVAVYWNEAREQYHVYAITAGGEIDASDR